MGDEQVASIEASIQSQIDSLITPTSVTLTIGEPVPPSRRVGICKNLCKTSNNTSYKIN